MPRARTLALTLALAVLALAAVAWMLVPWRSEPPPPLAPADEPSRLELPRDGLPDCPAGAMDDLLGADALECWFPDDGYGPWHVTSSIEVRGVIVVHLVATDVRVADGVTRRLVDQFGAGTVEVLLYADDARSSRVRRARWTPADGLEVTEFGGR